MTTCHERHVTIRPRGKRGRVAALFRGLARAALALLCVAGPAAAQTVSLPNGAVIANVAELRFVRSGVAIVRSSNEARTTRVPARTPATLTLERAAGTDPGAPALAPTRCDRGGVLEALPPPAASALLVETGIFHGGEVVFLRVTDRDQDRDATLPDTLRVRVESATTGDAEVLQLTETGNSSGEFVGYVPSEARAGAPSDCTLQVARDGELRGAYVDAQDAADQAEDRALVDPVGLVFDAVTGNPVSGARVRIVDAVTGQPAQVLGDDGVSAFPAEVVTGQQAVDAGGTLYLFAPGAFRFPVLAQPGDYRVQVVPPAGHAFPSARAEADLQALPGAPWRLNAGSFGQPYAVPAPPAANIDIPLDPVSAELALEKQSSTPLAAAGDFVQYRLTLTARDANGAVAGAAIDDLLPPGFRYVRGSARIDGERADDPEIATDGRHLTFTVGALAAAQRLELRYVTEVTPLASGSEARNVARARGGGGLVSNEAVAVVRLREDLFRTRATLVGRIGHGSCESAPQAAEGVRVYLEDGRYSVTDREGRYHFEALTPGTHVVQVDTVTLPAGSQVAACAGVNRTGGNSRSQFVELRAGSLWRADFVLTGAPPAVDARATDEAARPKPAAAAWPEVESLQPGIAIVWPAADAVPAMPSIKVAVQHAPRQQVELTVNGQPVGKLAFDGTSQNATRDVALSKWRGVDIREGDNELVAIVRDAAGTEVARMARVVHFSTGAVRAEFVPEASQLSADGRQRPRIAVRLTDRQGRPVRPNLQGSFQVLAPHRAWASVEALDDNALIATGNREPTWVVGEDGIVQLELEPTTTAGWATVRVALGRGQSREIRAWLEPAPRDWILVALAEGTAAYQTVSAHSTPTGVDEGLAEDGRVAFFAKGTIRGEYLLTVAYDSAKAPGATTRLKGEIDPDAVYTLYGDATETRYDAESQRNLYLKLERREFVALFGDFDTPFATVELARYARTFNGFRADFAGAGAQAAVFAADTRQQQQRDDLQGSGTSGPYRLSRRPLVANSDKVRIEVRDRFRSDRIVTTRELVRHLDYSIDFETGVILLREPLASRDPDFNPAFLVTEYEVLARAADAATTAGLRATAQLADGRIEAGVSYVSEGAADGRAALAGIDLRARLSPQSELRAEAAQTDQDGTGSQDAWLVEFTHASEAVEVRAYGREQQQGFGLGQQFAPDAGTRRLGVEARLHLSRALVQEIDIGHLQQLSDGSSRAEAAAELRYDLDGRTLGVGLRGVQDAVGDERQSSALATLSGSQEFLAGRARVRGRLETSLAGPAASADYPERAVLGLDYKLAPGTQLFTEYEHAIGDGTTGDTTRMGVRSQPWARATLTSGLQQQTSESGSRLYANLGLTQGWQATEQLSLDFGLDQGKALQDASDRPIQPGYPPASGADEDFVAGFAGAAWRAGPWMATARAELRNADSERRSVFSAGAYRELGSGRALSGALRQVDSRGADSRTRLTDLAFGWAHRPLDGRWMALDQADIIAESRESAAGDERSWRLVNNLNVNVALALQTQLQLQFGARYGESTFDGSRYSGFTGLYGGELRHALRGPWDLGVGGALMQASRSGTAEWSAGLDVGYEFARHAWISVGYNVKGFEDADFSGGRHTAQGPFIKLRVKADQGLLQGLGIAPR